MNLNFYPKDYNNQAYNQATYNNPNFNSIPYYNDNNSTLQALQKGTEKRLADLQNVLSPIIPNNTPQQNNEQEKPYYLFCGSKTDWDEFLQVNYNISENDIFNDYKLFLQAKQEIIQEQGKNKINTMKDKIRNINKGTKVDDTIKSNVKPDNTSEPNINRDSIDIVNRNSGEHSNGCLGTNKTERKEANRKK